MFTASLSWQLGNMSNCPPHPIIAWLLWHHLPFHVTRLNTHRFLIYIFSFTQVKFIQRLRLQHPLRYLLTSPCTFIAWPSSITFLFESLNLYIFLYMYICMHIRVVTFLQQNICYWFHITISCISHWKIRPQVVSALELVLLLHNKHKSIVQATGVEEIPDTRLPLGYFPILTFWLN